MYLALDRLVHVVQCSLTLNSTSRCRPSINVIYHYALLSRLSFCKILAQQKEQFCCHHADAFSRFKLANKCVCGRGSAPDPAGGAYSAPPDSLAGLRGPISKVRGRVGGGTEGRGWEGERRGKQRGGEWEGRKGEGECLTFPGGIEGPVGAVRL